MAWESLLSGLGRHDNASFSPRNVSPLTLCCCHHCTGTPTSSSFTSSNDSGRVSSGSSLPSASPPHPTRSPAPPAWSTHLTFTVSYSNSILSCSYHPVHGPTSWLLKSRQACLMQGTQQVL